MENVTLIWSFCAAFAILLAAACGFVWFIERRDNSALMLCVLGVAGAASAYFELGMMTSATPAEYGEWLRWYHLPTFFAFIGQVIFVHYYLGTARVSLMWTIIAMRLIVLVVNFSVHPNFNFSSIVSLREVTLFGDPVMVIDVAVVRSDWQLLPLTSLILVAVYIIDAVVRRWRKGDKDSRRKALAVSVGIVLPIAYTIVSSQLLIFGFLQIPVSNTPWFLGALLTMAYEMGRDVILSRQARLEVAELREKLAQTERVSALGQLASTLAHELSQPLAATASNVDAALQHLRREKPDVEELRSILGDIGKDDRRAADIITRMRELFKRRAIELKPINVEDVVQDVVSLVHSEAIAHNVVLRLLIEPSLPFVFGDRVHLSQVLLNLIANSIRAVQSQPRDARTVVVEARTDDAKGEVEITVRDSGPGIPSSMIDDVFKPFFTTKADGLGMGLALSRAIIEAHGGRMWTDQMPEQSGAIFRFALRRAPSQEHSADRSPYPRSTQEGARPEAAAWSTPL